MRWRDIFMHGSAPVHSAAQHLARGYVCCATIAFQSTGLIGLRAVWTTLSALANTPVAYIEHWKYGQAIDRTQVEPPLFVLGAWRSGTTHLHNLLAVDDRFGYPNLCHVMWPRTFLLSERPLTGMINRLVPNQRPQDAVKFGANEPQEEEFAMCALTGQASMICMGFPRNVAFYERFLATADLPTAELARWKAAYQYFLRKLTYKLRRPLVLKSPANTCRINLLLEMFPDARFVHIRRNPYDVFRSGKHTLLTAGPWWQLQRMDYQDDARFDQQLLRQMRIMYEGFFEQRSLIPAGRLHDVAFEDLERDPVGEIRRVYEALHLPDFGHVEGRLTAYVNSIAGYKKNEFKELPDDLRRQVHRELRQCFDEWGYAA